MHERNHLRCALVGVVVALLLNGCAGPTGEQPRFPKLGDLTGAVTELFESDPRSKSTPTPAALYKDGIDYFERGRYARSISFFQKLRDEYPFSEEAEAVELKIAEAYYRNEEYIQADETYKNYLTFQPTGRHIPHVKYQLGRVNLAQFTGVDRDLEKVRQARGYFESVIKDHPESEHAADARKKLTETRVHLAERELYIGNYYLEEERYPAARERFETVLREYGDTPTAPKAQAALAAMPAEAKDAAAKPPPADPPPEAPAAESAATEPPRLITKPGYEYEDPSRKTWYGYLNPFSWRDRGEEEPEERKVAAAPAAPADETKAPVEETAPPEQKKSWFSYLNPASWFEGGVEKPATQPDKPTPAETATAKAVVEGVDKTLGTGEPPKGGAPKPPVSALPPEEKETGPTPDDPAKVIGDIDTRLGGEKASASAPKAPAADPALFSVKKPKPATKEAAAGDEAGSGLLRGIDRQLGKEGIDTYRDLPPPPASP